MSIAAHVVASVGMMQSAVIHEDPGPPIGGIAIVVLLLIGAFLLGYLNYQSHKPFHLVRETSLPADEVLERLVRLYTVSGWQAPSQTDRGATFFRRAEPSCLITLLLFMLGVVPGLLYLFLGGRDLTVSALTRIKPDGTVVVEVLGNARSDGSLRIALRVLDALP